MFKLFFGISKAVSLAQRGDQEALSQLLSRNPGLIDQMKGGRTLLHIACQIRNYDMALMLILRGANIELKDSSDRTPLVFCIEIKAENIAQLLIERGANVDAKNSAGQSLLHICAAAGCSRVVAWLIDRGVDVDEVNKEGETPLLVALRVGTTSSLSVALTCIDRRANVFIPNKDGLLPIQIAREKGYIGIESAIKYLIEQQKLGLAPMQYAPKVSEESKDESIPLKKKKSDGSKKKMLDKAVVGVAQTALSLAASAKDSTLSGTITGATAAAKRKKKLVAEEPPSPVEGSEDREVALSDPKLGLDKPKKKKKKDAKASSAKTKVGSKDRSLVCGFAQPKFLWCSIS